MWYIQNVGVRCEWSVMCRGRMYATYLQYTLHTYAHTLHIHLQHTVHTYILHTQILTSLLAFLVPYVPALIGRNPMKAVHSHFLYFVPCTALFPPCCRPSISSSTCSRHSSSSQSSPSVLLILHWQPVFVGPSTRDSEKWCHAHCAVFTSPE